MQTSSVVVEQIDEAAEVPPAPDPQPDKVQQVKDGKADNDGR